jgi:hypothetical protein
MGIRRLVLLSSLALCVVLGTFGLVTGAALAASPTISGVSFSSVGVSEVTLSATINPEGSSTAYKFEYGTTTGYGSSTPTVMLGSGTEGIGVQEQLEGLQPDTTYHFRLVAGNESGSSASSDGTFTTFGQAFLGLPDDRGYEKVSPNDNADGNVYAPSPIELFAFEADFNEQPYVASEDGNALAYMAYPPETGGNGHEGGDAGNQYVTRRLPGGGWSANDISPPSEAGYPSTYQGFSKNLSAGIVMASTKQPLASGAPGGEFSVPYVRDLESESYTSLLTVLPPNSEVNHFYAYGVSINAAGSSFEPAYAGSSADLKHVLWMVNDALTANAVDGGEEQNNLYDTHEGQLTLVNVLPDGSSEPNAVFGGPPPPPYGYQESNPSFSHAISEDGSRIFWTDLNTHNLYMRENGATTVQVDAGVGGGVSSGRRPRTGRRCSSPRTATSTSTT